MRVEVYPAGETTEEQAQRMASDPGCQANIQSLKAARTLGEFIELIGGASPRLSVTEDGLVKLTWAVDFAAECSKERDARLIASLVALAEHPVAPVPYGLFEGLHLNMRFAPPTTVAWIGNPKRTHVEVGELPPMFWDQ